LCKRVDDAFLLSDHLLENTLEAYQGTVAFNTWLNEAVKYALED
jgi:hypothetical protein